MKLNPLLIISIIFAASFSGRAITLASATTHARGAAQAGHVGDSKPEAGEPEALKQTEKAIETAIAATSPADQAEAAPPPELPAKLAPALPDADQGALLASIRERSAQLDRREAAIAERARLLEIVEKRIDEKTAALAEMKTELENRLTFAETAAEQDIVQLARMYESMKPARAGEIFNAMEPAFAAGFLTQMNRENAALVLANMETQKAYAASIIIAGRNAAVNSR